MLLLKRLFLAMLFCMVAALPVAAQTSEWQPATLVYESALVDNPNLVADASGTLHLVWAGVLRNQDGGFRHSLLYAQFTEDGWSTPNDVVVMNEVDVRVPVAAIDSRGIMHVVWGGNGLNYSSVPTWEAESAANWSKPIKIGTGGLINSPIGLQIGPDDALHIVAAIVGERETYYIQSHDAGGTWAAPRRISSTPQDAAADVAGVALDSKGVLHAVWSRVEFPFGYPPVGVYYAYSADNGQTWTTEQPLAGLDYGEPTIAVDSNDVVHVAYNGRVDVGGKFHRTSVDGGATWGAPLALVAAGRDGLNGSAELVADAEGGVYYVAGGDKSVYLAAWRDGRWSQLLDLRDTIVGSLEETERTSMKLLVGNQLHSVFENGKYQFWHTWRTLDVSAIPPIDYTDVQPNVESTAAQTTIELAPIVSDPFLAAPAPVPDATQTALADPNDGLVISIMTSLALLGLVVAIQLLRQRAR